MIKILIFTVTFLTAALSFAQRTVGNGGGLAEMKMIYLFENLDLYLAPCLATNDPCALSSVELKQLNEISKNLQTQRSGKGIRFEAGIIGDARSEGSWGDLLVYDSQALYQSSGVSKEVGELGQILIEGLALKTTSGAASALGNRVFAGLRENIQSVATGELLLHHLQIQRSFETRSLLVLENPTESLDLTDKVAALIPCKALNSYSVDRMNATKDFFLVDLTWSCGPSEVLGHGVLIVKNATEIQIVGVSP